MKKLWSLITILAVISCQPEKNANYTIVSGKIENANANNVTIYSAYNSDHKIEITLADDGTFKDTLKMATDFYILRQDRNATELYIPKGDDIYITYNAKKKDSTLQFTGSTNVVNKYISDKEKLTTTIKGDQKELFLKDEINFKEHLLKIKTAQENLLTKTDGISEDYKNNELKSINYQYFTFLNMYQTYHGYYLKDRKFKTSANFLDALKNVDLENENDFLFSQNYRNVVSYRLRNKAEELVKKDSIANDIAYLKSVAAIKNDIIRSKLLFDDAKYGITYTENLDEYYKIFVENSTDVANNTKIETDYKKLKALAEGSPSPKFVDYENNAGGNTSLDNLKGKYLYLDIWATWCGPCIAEIPSLKKVEKEFHNKNIEFISISIDRIKDHEKWKKMIVDKELGGMQLFADSDWESQFIQDYMIKGIPRFILIDPQGNIINANAPRPSDKKLVEKLTSLNL